MASARTCTDYADVLNAWPNCEIPDCPNKCCLALRSSKCWPHTVGQPFNCHNGMTDRQIEAFNRKIEGDSSKLMKH